MASDPFEDMTCSICLEPLNSKHYYLGNHSRTDIVSTCCCTSICGDCAADWATNSNPLKCSLCHLNMNLAGNSVNHPVIQSSLRRQGNELADFLLGYHTNLTTALHQLADRRAIWLNNVEELTGELSGLTSDQAPDQAPDQNASLTQQLETFYKSTAKEFYLEEADLKAKLNTTAVRLKHLQSYLTQETLPLTIMIVAQQWRDLAINLPQVTYQRQVWYQHPLATPLATNSCGYTIKPQALLPLQSVKLVGLVTSVSDIDPEQCFVDWSCHVRLYHRIDGGPDQTFKLQVVDLTALADHATSSDQNDVSLVLQSQLSDDDVVEIETVTAVSAVSATKPGYLVFVIHKDSLQTTHVFRPTRKIVILYFDQYGHQRWSKQVTSKHLVHIEVYQDQVLIFGDQLHVWKLLRAEDGESNGLNYQGYWLLGKTEIDDYRFHHRNQEYLYFVGDGDTYRDDHWYRFDATNLKDLKDHSNPVLSQVTELDLAGTFKLAQSRSCPRSCPRSGAPSGLRWYQPIMLPGLTLFYTLESAGFRKRQGKIWQWDLTLLNTGLIVPLPDLDGRVYKIVE